MKPNLPASAAFAALCSASAWGQPVINEIFYNPPGSPEPIAQEWIELHNPTAEVVDMSGYKLTKGVNVTFASGVQIPAHGYLVVVANTTAFALAHAGTTNFVGPWTGSLSNSGETIRLEDSTGAEVDSVTYSDEGDWAPRLDDPTYSETAFIWNSLADGGNRSLELINPALSNNNGQNWVASTGIGGTPGLPNSGALPNIAPLISKVKHDPPIPAPGEQITITCELADEVAVASASLFWRVSSFSPPSFSQVPMVDDGTNGDSVAGDGKYTARITAPSSENSVVEFYVRGSDGTNARAWPAPVTNNSGTSGQFANALIHVQSGASGDAAPTYRVAMTVSENNEFQNVSTSINYDPTFNCTLILADADGPTIRYRCGIRIRGNSSRSFNPHPLRVEIPQDEAWHDETRFNLNSRYTYSQYLGMQLFAAAGLPAPKTKPVRVLFNGSDRARTDERMYGRYVHMAALGSEMVDDVFPDDNGGNLYKKASADLNRDLKRWGVHWTSGSPVVQYYNPNWYLTDAWNKMTNEGASNWTDLTNFAKTWWETAPTSPSYLTTIGSTVDIDQWLRWFALMNILNDRETNLSNGIDDDYAIYRGEVDQRFKLVPHDLDTIFGFGDTTSTVSDTLTDQITPTSAVSGDDQIPQLTAFFQNPEISRRYAAQFVDLLNTVLSQPNFNARVDHYLTGWVPATPDGSHPIARSTIKTFMDGRRNYVLGIVNQSLTATSSLALQNGYPRTPNATMAISGKAALAKTAAVKVNGINATWNSLTGDWSIISVTLTPGINRIVIQTFDSDGALLETRFYDVWFDDGSTQTLVSNITATTTLTAAGGPYVIPANTNIQITNNAVLTIQAGANIYFGDNARITATATGTLRILGTEYAHVRLGPDPTAPLVADIRPGLANAQASWDGIKFDGSNKPENAIVYADFVRSQDDANNRGAVGLLNGSYALVDHCSFAQGTHLRIIYANNSSGDVQYCVFPDMFTGSENPETLNIDNIAEPIKTEGAIPAGGHFVIRGNSFGTNRGHNDVVDFTSSKLPNPIVQIIGNTFAGGGDDLIDLSGDAWIEGNLFLNAHKDVYTSDHGYASAITTGDDAAVTDLICVVRNVFLDCDHCVNLKAGASAIFEQNTVARLNSDFTDRFSAVNVISALNLFVPTDTAPTAGTGVHAGDNIFWQTPRVFGNADLPSGTTSALQMAWNFLRPELAATAVGTRPGSILDLGTGNSLGDPHFVDFATRNFKLLPGSPARGAGRFGQDCGAEVPGGIFLGHLPPAQTTENSASIEVGGPGIVAYRYRLNGGSFGAETAIGAGGGWTPPAVLTRSAALSLTALAPGTYALEVQGKTFAGEWVSPTTSYTWEVVSTIPAGVQLSEVLAANVSAVNVVGTFPDFVELHNPGSAAMNLEGYHLSDDPAVLDKYTFPPGTSISPRGYLVVSSTDLGFSLDDDGETLILTNSANSVLDTITFGLQISDKSIGRSGADWVLCLPTLGLPNRASALGNPAALRINEWIADHDFRVKDDFVELYNPDPLPVELSGLGLTDEPNTPSSRHLLPDLSFIDGAGFIYLRPTGDASTGGAKELPFKLDPINDWIVLYDAAGREIDRVLVQCRIVDVSQGRSPDGASTFADFTLPTPGTTNIPASSQQLALLNFLRITEILYAPLNAAGTGTSGGGDYEFIELKNIGPASLDLTGVRISLGVDFVFPSMILEPAQSTVVVKSITRFIERNGAGHPIAGQFERGNLDNGGESIALMLPAPYDINILCFDYQPSWQPLADAAGHSLEIIDPVNTLPGDWDERESWKASAQPGGTPPILEVPSITSALAATGLLNDPFSYQITAGHGPTSFNATGLPAWLSVNPSTGLLSGTPPVGGVFPVTIIASNVAGSDSALLTITISNSGPLDHFTISSINSPQQKGVGFPLTVTARDAQERLVSTYSGVLSLTAVANYDAGFPTVVFTECDDRALDLFELQNVHSQPMETTGWFVAVNNGGTGDINALTLPIYHLPASLAAGEVLAVDDSNDGTNAYFGGNIPWNNATTRKGWALLGNGSGQVVDFVIWGYTPAEMADWNPGEINGFTINPFTSGQWSGNSIAHPSNGTSLQRIGSRDGQVATDWAWQAASTALQNPGLAAPFIRPVELPSTPLEIELTNGLWLGVLFIQATGNQVILQVDDGASHLGESVVFQVIVGPPDADGDGLSDAWEASHGLNSGVADSETDADGDGRSNRAEFLAGTDPGDPNSHFDLTGHGVTPGGQVHLDWSSVPGKLYRVCYSTDLGLWHILPGSAHAATGPADSATFNEPPTVPGERTFYKVEVLGP